MIELSLISLLWGEYMKNILILLFIFNLNMLGRTLRENIDYLKEKGIISKDEKFEVNSKEKIANYMVNLIESIKNREIAILAEELGIIENIISAISPQIVKTGISMEKLSKDILEIKDKNKRKH